MKINGYGTGKNTSIQTDRNNIERNIESNPPRKPD